MKKSLVFFLILSFILIWVGCKKATESKKVSMDSTAAKRGYAMGYNFGKNIKDLSADIDKGALIKGIKDALEGNKPMLNDKEVQQVLSSFQKELIQKDMEKRKAAGDANLAEEKNFLEKNKKRPEVKTTPSGLQYEVIKEGTGPHPKPTDTVIVHYRGTFLDGKEFDSSYKRNQPAKFQLNKVIPGWVEGLQLMRVGAKYKFYIPSKLAYGERGAGNVIGPNKLLVFEVELLGIEKSKK